MLEINRRKRFADWGNDVRFAKDIWDCVGVNWWWNTGLEWALELGDRASVAERDAALEDFAATMNFIELADGFCSPAFVSIDYPEDIIRDMLMLYPTFLGETKCKEYLQKTMRHEVRGSKTSPWPNQTFVVYRPYMRGRFA